MTYLRKRMIEDLTIRNYAPGTIKAYIGYVAKFAMYFRKSPDLLGPKQIRQYLVYLVEEKGVSVGTLTQVVAALRFLYCITLRRETVLPFIPYPRKERKLPIVLAVSEVRDFLAAVPNPKHHALLATMYSTGLRVNEAVNLLLQHIDLQRMTIFVQKGKRNKDRYVPLFPSLFAVLDEYMKNEHPRLYLFPRFGVMAPLTRYTPERICKKVCKKLGFTKVVTPHTLRHSFATHMLEAGADLKTIQHFLGHASLASTSIYLHIAVNSRKVPEDAADLLARVNETPYQKL